MALGQTIIDGLTVPMTLIRRGLWASTNGNSGITRPRDLRVTALPTPGPAIYIAKGGAMITTTYPQAYPGETYPVQNDIAHQFDIPATTSSGPRTDYITVRIDDWNYNGSQPPTDLTAATGCSFQRVSSLADVGGPYIPLAMITIPASTATITDAMITDLRTMAVQQSKSVSAMHPIVTGDAGLGLNATSAAGEVFPNAGNTAIDIPPWATRAKITAFWTSMRYPANKNCFGRYWVQYGNVGGTRYVTQTMQFDATGVNNNSATNWVLLDEVPIPAALRGATSTFYHMARYDGPDKGVSMTTLSGVALSVEFLANADMDIVEID